MAHLLSTLPTWIFFLFAYLLYIGYTQSKTRKVTRFRITILPLIMLSLSLYGVLNVPNSLGYALIAWVAGLGLALYLNAKIPHGHGVTMHDGLQHYLVPGSWIPLILLMSVFFAKFTIGYLTGAQIVSATDSHFIMISSGVSGLISGTFLARALQIFRTGTKHAKTYILASAT